jgi:bacteriorhodopsin
LLHWIGTNTDTHGWSGDAVVALAGGAGLMALAIVLVARPWSGPTARTIYLVGAVATTVLVIAFLLPVLSGVTTGHVDTSGHAAHDVGGGEGVATANAIRTTLEVVLVGVLVWMHRRTGRPSPEVTETPG